MTDRELAHLFLRVALRPAVDRPWRERGDCAIPAQRTSQALRRRVASRWIPALAGMTKRASPNAVLCFSLAKRSNRGAAHRWPMGCFVASLLAMTDRAPLTRSIR